MSTREQYTLLARRAVAEINEVTSQRFANMALKGQVDNHIEMRVALKAIELAVEELVRPEDIQTMLATGKDGDTVVKTKDGGLTWTSVPYEQHKARVLGDKPLAATD
jgi:hypothetical protein